MSGCRLLVVVLLASASAGCETRDPCVVLADRDCARFGENSATCIDSRSRADARDPFLREVCRNVIERGEAAWRARPEASGTKAAPAER